MFTAGQVAKWPAFQDRAAGLLCPGLDTPLASPLTALPTLPPGPCPGLVLPSSSSAWWPPERLCRHTSHTEPPSFGFSPHFSSRSSAPWGSDLIYLSADTQHVPSTWHLQDKGGVSAAFAGEEAARVAGSQPGTHYRPAAPFPGPGLL